MINGEIINLHQNAENDEVAREISDRVMKQRMFERQADQLDAVALNKESLNEMNDSEVLRREANKRKGMSHLIACSFKNANISSLRGDQPSQNSARQ